MSHENINEKCTRCSSLFDRYPNFDADLRTWFEALRLSYPDAHISSAGRGRIDQEVCFQRGASRAHFEQSAHNYNAAIDIFQLKEGNAVWDTEWFARVIGANLEGTLNWYGKVGAPFYELPHVEISAWKDLVKTGHLRLVE